MKMIKELRKSALSKSIFGGVMVAAALTLGAPVMAEDTKKEAGNSEKTVLNATDSNPKTLGWMQGFPPPADKTIRCTDPDYFAFPKLRWTACHFLMSTTPMAS